MSEYYHPYPRPRAGISPLMAEARDKLREHGQLIREGGLWTYPDCPRMEAGRKTLPRWSCSTETIAALVTANHASYSPGSRFSIVTTFNPHRKRESYDY